MLFYENSADYVKMKEKMQRKPTSPVYILHCSA
jgi:hypothetical protein